MPILTYDHAVNDNSTRVNYQGSCGFKIINSFLLENGKV